MMLRGQGVYSLYYLCFAPLSTTIGTPVIWRPYLPLSRIHPQVGVPNRLVVNHLGSSAARLWCYSFKDPLTQRRNRHAIEAAILNLGVVSPHLPGEILRAVFRQL